jgi:mono/diheme cytochrome c family protein
MRRTLPEKQRSGDRLVLLENLDHCSETGAGDLPATQPRWRKLSAMLLIAAVILSLGACAGPHWRDRGPVTPWTGPMGGRLDGPGMMGYGPGSGYGPGMHGYGRSTGGDGSSAGMSMLRHRQAMMGGIPSGYAGLRNPLPVNRSVIDSGETLYEANCAACHGSKGAGDGPAAAGQLALDGAAADRQRRLPDVGHQRRRCPAPHRHAGLRRSAERAGPLADHSLSQEPWNRRWSRSVCS